MRHCRVAFNLQEESVIMETYGIEKYGITGTTEIVYNPSYEQLF